MTIQNLNLSSFNSPSATVPVQTSNLSIVEEAFVALNFSQDAATLQFSGKRVDADSDRVAYIGEQEVSLTIKKERLFRAKKLLKTAESLFSKYDTLNKDQKLILESTLKKAYKIFHQENLFSAYPNEVARLLFMYGRNTYPAVLANCKQVMIASLALSFGITVDSLNKTDKLENLFAVLNETKELDYFITDILHTPKFLELFAFVQDKNKFNVALTHRWLGHTLQNTSEANGSAYKQTSKELFEEMRGEVADYFTRYYGNTIEAFEKVGSDDAELQILETRYNSDRFIINTRKDNQVFEAIASLLEIEKLATKDTLAHKRLRSQIVNARTLEKNKLKPSAENKAELAMFIREQYQDVTAISKMALQTPGFDRFQTTLYLSNRFKWALEARRIGFPVATDEELKIMSILLKARIKTSGDHLYFPYFYNGLADYENTVLNNRAVALDYLKLADEMNSRMGEEDSDQLAFRKKNNLEK